MTAIGAAVTISKTRTAWITGNITGTLSGEVTANVAKINSVTVIGTGTSGDKWRA